METFTHKQKKIAVINDLSGYGRCSLTVALPILSAMGHQACPVPTAILSNHTEFPVYFFDDYTEKMPAYTDKWVQLGLSFDGIATGFLGSAEQIAMVIDMVESLSGDDTLVLVDPVMGDHGRLYATYTEEMCEEMKLLVSRADVTTPNVTEACILTGTPYKEKGWTRRELLNMAMMLRLMGARSVVRSPGGKFYYQRGPGPGHGRPLLCQGEMRRRTKTGDGRRICVGDGRGAFKRKIPEGSGGAGGPVCKGLHPYFRRAGRPPCQRRML